VNSRADRLRIKLAQMRDVREVAAAHGYELTVEAKAKLYDIQQDIIRSALDADDAAIARERQGPATEAPF